MAKSVALIYAPIDDEYYTDGVNDSLPLGLLSLSNYAAKQGLSDSFDILDGEYYPVQEILGLLPNYDMVFVQSMQASYSNTLAILAEAKSLGLATYMGGHHATQLFGQILTNRHEILDGIVRGDGEVAFVAILEGRPPAEIPNLARWQDGKVQLNRMMRLPVDDNLILDIEPRMFEQYLRPPVRDTKLERLEPLTSMRAFSHKGCSNRSNSQYCYFCGRADQGVRFKTPENYVKELEFLASLPSVRYIFEIGDDFLQDEEWLAEVAKLYRRRLGDSPVELKIFARANRVRPSVIPALRDLNITEVAIGFESGSHEILERISKNATPDDNMNAARLLFSEGIDTVVSYVLGLPGEDNVSLNATLDQAREIRRLAMEHLGRPPQEIIANIIEINPGAPAFRDLVRALPGKYRNRDLLDVKETQDDYFRVTFGLADDAEVEAFRHRLAAYGSRINELGSYSYRAGWTWEDVAHAV